MSRRRTSQNEQRKRRAWSKDNHPNRRSQSRERDKIQDQDDGFENAARDELIQELRENLARCRKVLLDENLDLKTHERWTQLYNNTSTVLNQVLKDRQMKDWERRMRVIEEYQRDQRET